MNRTTIYYWYFRKWLSRLFLAYIGVAILILMSNFVLDAVGAGSILKAIAIIILFGSASLGVVMSFIGEWPPNEEQVREWKEGKKRRKEKSRRGPGATSYRCENCGEDLESRDEIIDRSSYRCAYCDYELDNQIRAKDIYNWEM